VDVHSAGGTTAGLKWPPQQVRQHVGVWTGAQFCCGTRTGCSAHGGSERSAAHYCGRHNERHCNCNVLFLKHCTTAHIYATSELARACTRGSAQPLRRTQECSCPPPSPACPSGRRLGVSCSCSRMRAMQWRQTRCCTACAAARCGATMTSTPPCCSCTTGRSGAPASWPPRARATCPA
jgi:hypothetical protein